MLHKLKISLITLICLLSSSMAFTLGVGDIKVNSSLNEPLDAVISIEAVRDTEVDNIRVNLASRKEFNDAGIDKVLVLSDLKFKVVYGKTGKAVVKVTSSKPIREPFLDFLVEINWPTGRLLREYTMLLDPPIFAQAKAAPQQAPRVVAVDITPTPTVAKEIIAERPKGELFPRIDIKIDETATIDNEPSTLAKKSAPSFTGNTYGPVVRNETLWSIANQVRPDTGVSLDQVMMSLLRANPQAFSNNNINGLNKGKILRVPDRAEMASITQAEARRLTIEQNTLWRSIRDAAAGKVAEGTVTGAAPTPDDNNVQGEAGIKIITPSGGKTGTQGTGANDGGATSEQLALANEKITSGQQENTDLRQQVDSLKDQIGSMERLIDLKDQSLADLQSKLGDDANKVVAEDITPEPVAPVVVAEDITPPSAAIDEPVVAADVAPEAVEVADVEVEAEPEQIALNSNNPYALDNPPKVVIPKPPVATQPAESADTGIMGIITDLLSQPLNIGILLAVIIVLVALTWISINRRRMASMQFPESILTSGASAPASGGSTPPPTMARAATDPTSILSDFAPSAMDTSIETEVGEVDPLSEADVYLAYGKHDQAEELLRNAVAQEPDRLDLKLKLMEVFHATGNETDFLTLAEQMHGMVDGQSTALWDKAVEMGRELCPESSLFADAASGDDDFSDLDNIADLDDFEASLDAVSTDDSDELELELPTFETAVDAEEAAVEPKSSLSLDVDEMEFNTDIDEVSTEEAKVDFGDFNLDDGDSGKADDEPAADDGAIGIDEVATKLDLAKAYIDMGDPDGAKAILDEVMTEGNDSQKSEAQELVSQL